MNDLQYREYESVFEPLAREKLLQLAQALAGDVPGGFGPVETVDMDNERGLGLTQTDATGDPLWINLMLTDGDEYGFEGVGLVLTCSVYASGQVWAPANYTPAVGTLDKVELARRVAEMPVADVAERIRQEWSRLSLQGRLVAKGYDLDELERDSPYSQWEIER